MYLHHEQFIKNYELRNTKFYNFCQNATREEFLKSQIGFFYAVQAFPQMLCKLASQIETSEIRLKLVENIWEEHGHGVNKNFHTESFMCYLKALGLREKSIEHNFFVDNWIKECLSLSLSSAQYSTYLAGIEYIYAKISLLICKTLENFDLLCEQNHYAKHSELDFHHAQDLLNVSYNLEQTENYEIFCISVNRFMDLFNQITFITEKEVQKISQEKIAFYYSREDSEIEISSINNQSPYILTVCSGGEHIIHIKNAYPNAKIVALDINAHQIELTQNKIKNILDHQNNPIFNVGKFELLFEYFSSKIDNNDIQKIKENDYVAIKKLELICCDVFSNHNLNVIFTNEATKYSSDEFSLHFFNVFLDKIKNMNNEHCNMANILGKSLPNKLPLFINTSDIEYFHGEFESFLKLNCSNFDLISISNIGDWMPQDRYIVLIDKIIQSLKPKGTLIARKLLGDYSLNNIFSNHFNQCYPRYDNTGFYTECMVGIK